VKVLRTALVQIAMLLVPGGPHCHCSIDLENVEQKGIALSLSVAARNEFHQRPPVNDSGGLR
jgi:hypothetical protein